MKILLYFADMVRADLLNEGSDKDSFDLNRVLNSLGGIRFKNAHTPSPDTPRSLGVFFTGKFPKNNGCVSRSDWPGHSIEESQIDLFTAFLQSGFEVLTCVYPIEVSTGRFFPRRVKKSLQYFRNLGDLSIRSKNIGGDQLIFIQDNDYHFEVDDRFGHYSAHKAGQKRVARNLEGFLNRFPSEYFDITVVFSDHGCRFSSENQSPRTFLEHQ